VLTAATQHRGSAFVEIYQNCPIFNDGAFDVLKDKDESARRIVPLRPGEPIVFGPENEYAVVRGDFGFDIAKVADIDPDTIVTHDPTIADPAYAFALSRLGGQDLSHTPIGIFRQVDRTTYDDAVRAQVESARQKQDADLQALLNGSDTWTVA